MLYMEEQKENYELKFTGEPPYEVLSTKWLSYSDILKLKRIEEMVEVHYNSGQFGESVKMLEQEFEQPFDLYEALADWYEEKGGRHWTEPSGQNLNCCFSSGNR